MAGVVDKGGEVGLVSQSPALYHEKGEIRQITAFRLS